MKKRISFKEKLLAVIMTYTYLLNLSEPADVRIVERKNELERTLHKMYMDSKCAEVSVVSLSYARAVQEDLVAKAKTPEDKVKYQALLLDTITRLDEFVATMDEYDEKAPEMKAEIEAIYASMFTENQMRTPDAWDYSDSYQDEQAKLSRRLVDSKKLLPKKKGNNINKAVLHNQSRANNNI